MIKSLLKGWHFGKGFKYMKAHNFNKALVHFFKVFKYCELEIDFPITMESIAEAFFYLGEFEQASQYAESSFELYKKCEESGIEVKDRLERMAFILEHIKQHKYETEKDR